MSFLREMGAAFWRGFRFWKSAKPAEETFRDIAMRDHPLNDPALWKAMESEDPTAPPDPAQYVDVWTPWHPITDPVHLKYLVKPLEELGELVSIVARLVIQGWNGVDPKTKKSNVRCMEDEIADVEASCELLKKKFNLDRQRIAARKDEKIMYLEPLHEAAGKTL